MVRKAVIPIAGKGMRMMPISSVVPKALLPVVDGRRSIRSVLHIICEQAVSAGIEQVGIVVSPWQEAIIRKYFVAAQASGYTRLPADIEYIVQASPKGFGDAVMLAADFVGDESFMLLLGDHVYIQSFGEPSCPAQVAAAFDVTGGVAMIGMQPVSIHKLSEVGVATGFQINQGIYCCTDFVEKPDLTIARQRLGVDDLPADTFLAHCGIYIFIPLIFGCLLRVSEEHQSGSELELADAQAMLLKRCSGKYFLYKITGKAYNIGTPAGYAETLATFR